MIVPGFKHVSKNVAITWLHKVFAVVVTFFVTGLATRVFGLEVMGLWVMAMSVAAYLQVLDVGVSSSLPRLLPRLRASGDEDMVGRILSTVFVLTIVLGAMGLIFSPVIAWLVSTMYEVSAPEEEVLYWLIFITTVFASITVPFRLGFGLLATVHRFDLFFAIEIVALIFKFAFVYAALIWFDYGIIRYGVIVAMIPLISSVFQVWLGLKSVGVRIGWPLRWFRKEAKVVLSSCGAAFFMTLAGILHVQGGNLVAATDGPIAAAMVGYPMMLVMNAMSFGGSFGAFLTPVVSGLKGVKDQSKLSSITMDTVKGAFSVAILTAAVLVISGQLLLTLWLGGHEVGADAIAGMAHVLQVLAIGSAFLLPSLVAKGMLMSTGRHWDVAVVDFVSAAFGLGLSALIMMFYGLDKFVYVLSATLILRGLCGVSWLAAKECRVSYWHYFRRTAMIPILIGIVMWLCVAAASAYFEQKNDFIQVGLKVIVVAFVWSLLTWYLVLEQELRTRAILFLRKKIDRLWKR